MLHPKQVWPLFKKAVQAWSNDYAPSMGAALSYYTLFSIAPLLLIVIAVAGWFFGEDQGRYLLACRPEAVADLMARAREARVPLRDVGEAGGDEVRLGGSRLARAEVARVHAEGLGRLLG